MPPQKKLSGAALQPVATAQRLPLETPQFRGLDRLANTLEDFGTNVTKIAVRKANEDAEEKEQQGILAAQQALAAGRGTVDQMEEDKLITRGDNPFYRQGVFRALGQAKAYAFGNALTVAYGEGVDPKTTNPEEVDGIIASVSAEFSTEDDNEAMLEGFSAQAAQQVQRLRDTHAGIVSSNMEGLGNTLFTANTVAAISSIDQFAPDQRVSGTLALLNGIIDEHLATFGDNIKPNDFRVMNRSLVNGIVAMAADPSSSFTGAEAIAIMEQLTTHKGAKLFHIPEFKELVTNAITKRAGIIQTRINNQHTNDLLAQAKAEEEVLTAFAETGYSEAGLRDALQAVHSAAPGVFAAGTDFDLVAKQRAWDEWMQRDIVDNRAVHDQLLGGFLSEEITTSRVQIENAVFDGDISATTGLQLQAKLKEQQDIRKNDPRTMGVYREAADQVEAGLGGHLPTDMSAQAFLEARLALRQGVDSWLERNPGLDETSEEFENWLLPFILRLQKKHLTTYQQIQGQQQTSQVAFKTIAFRETNFGLSEDQLVSLMAENSLLRDGSSGYDASDEYYDFFLTDGRMSDNDVNQWSLTRTALLDQLTLGDIDPSEKTFSRKVEAKKTALLNIAAMRSAQAAQAVSSESLMSTLEAQADAMGLSPDEASRIVQARQDSLRQDQ